MKLSGALSTSGRTAVRPTETAFACPARRAVAVATSKTTGCPQLETASAPPTRTFAAPPHSRMTTRRARQTSVVAAASLGNGNYEPYPFEAEEYQRAELVRLEPYGPMKMLPDPQGCNTYNGVLVFQAQGTPLDSADSHVMEVFVAGDTSVNIYALLHEQRMERPLPHDLLWSVLNRVAHEGPQRWALLRVAIVELRNDVYIGRLFFGNPEDGEVYYDQDCRPSDGCYLHLMSQCPFYISKAVWRQAAVPLRTTTVYRVAQAEAGASQRLQAEEAAAAAAPTWSLSLSGSSSSAPPTPALHEAMVLRADDLDAIKLLKRQMAVAVVEENYREAIRLRDHPWMKTYRRVAAYRAEGRRHEADLLERDLRYMIENNQASAEQLYVSSFASNISASLSAAHGLWWSTPDASATSQQGYGS